jgi:DNA polymerase-3 subunit gamma/tau
VSYQVLARKYRPQVYSEVIGQDVSVTIMKNSIKMGRVPSGMLISGVRGTGKTTLARIYAKSLNCQSSPPGEDPCRTCPSCIDAENDTHPDIFEFDAASNNGVDFVRSFEDYVLRVKTYNRKVFIFDEVHMFTPQAQAAFLKLLEEPPQGVTFILVTTDPEKLVRTVRSRCLSMPLTPLTVEGVAESVKRILQSENIPFTDSFISDISLLSDGSLRDVQQYLDQVILASNGDTLDSGLLESMFGILSGSVYRDLAGVLNFWNVKYALQTLENWYSNGVDLQKLYLDGIPNLLRDMLLYLNGFDGKAPPFLSGIPVESFRKKMKLNADHIKYLTNVWKEFSSMMEESGYPKSIFTMFFAAAFGNN